MGHLAFLFAPRRGRHLGFEYYAAPEPECAESGGVKQAGRAVGSSRQAGDVAASQSAMHQLRPPAELSAPVGGRYGKFPAALAAGSAPSTSAGPPAQVHACMRVEVGVQSYAL